MCAGLNQEMKVLIKGHVGYYCAGMNQKAHITIDGNVGTGVAENMMSGISSCKRKCLTICWCNCSWRFVID